MFGPSSGNDRDALRRALHVSLRDVLMDVAADTATVPASRDAVFAPQQGQQQLGFNENPHLQAMASRHLGLSSGLMGQNSSYNMGASLDQQHFLNAAMMNEQRLLQQARNALTKQRLLAEEKKRQMLLEENKQRMLEGSYMSYLREKMSKDKPEGQDNNIPPLALLALQGSRMAQRHQEAAPPTMSTPSNASQKKISNPLEALGSTLRNVDDPYVDVSDIQEKSTSEPAQRKARGGVQIPFPEKMHTMLKAMEEQGKTDIVSFYSHGRAFGVHDPDRFVQEIMPKYFKMGKWNSFARQLNLYGFVRITSGPDAGGYYHELFLKGRPNLCQHMRRVGVPQGMDRRKNKTKSQASDPDFYAMKPVA